MSGMDDGRQPAHDVFSEANVHAALIREYHEAYVRLGFTDAQAFALTGVLLRGLIARER